jgi:hypothetical protein
LTAATETKQRALFLLLSMHRMKLRVFLLANKVMRKKNRRRERKCFVPLRRVKM